MKLLFLPGNSPTTKDWAESICRRLEKHISGYEVQNYLHWTKREPNIDVAAEVQRFQELVKRETDPLSGNCQVGRGYSVYQGIFFCDARSQGNQSYRESAAFR